MHHHAHHHDCSGHGRYSSVSALSWSILLIVCFGIIEAIAGVWSHSLALLSDAGHMGSDALALSIAAFAAWMAKKPPSDKHSYGLGRAEVLAAWVSSMLLMSIAVAVIVEAIFRIHGDIKAINGLTVMLVASIGVAVNLVVAWILSRSEKNLNTRAALLHVLSDLLASLGALLSGAIIHWYHWTIIDPILSIVIGTIILSSAVRLLKDTSIVLMESVPQHIEFSQVKQDMAAINGVLNVHDLHIWTLASGTIALSAHVNIEQLDTWEPILAHLKQCLREQYHINHVTLQPEPKKYPCNPCRG